MKAYLALREIFSSWSGFRKKRPSCSPVVISEEALKRYVIILADMHSNWNAYDFSKMSGVTLVIVFEGAILKNDRPLAEKARKELWKRIGK